MIRNNIIGGGRPDSLVPGADLSVSNLVCVQLRFPFGSTLACALSLLSGQLLVQIQSVRMLLPLDD